MISFFYKCGMPIIISQNVNHNNQKLISIVYLILINQYVIEYISSIKDIYFQYNKDV